MSSSVPFNASTSSIVVKQCHVCGKDFNKAALPVHQQRCIQSILTKIKSSKTNTREPSASTAASTSRSTATLSNQRQNQSPQKPALTQQQSGDSFDDIMQRGVYNVAAPAAGPSATFKTPQARNSVPVTHQHAIDTVPIEKLSLSNSNTY